MDIFLMKKALLKIFNNCLFITHIQLIKQIFVSYFCSDTKIMYQLKLYSVVSPFDKHAYDFIAKLSLFNPSQSSKFMSKTLVIKI